MVGEARAAFGTLCPDCSKDTYRCYEPENWGEALEDLKSPTYPPMLVVDAGVHYS